MRHSLGTIREFRTDQFRVVVDALPEDDLDLSFDDDGSVAAGLKSGEFMAFCVRARVIHDSLGEIGSDYLGGCIYRSLEEFQDHKECAAYNRKLRESGSNAVCGSYFADMIASAIKQAREHIANMKTPYIRIPR